jgi:putative membrane protein
VDPRRLFTAADLDAIRAATAAVERRTPGEVMVVIVGRCDGYEEASWKAAALLAGAAALAAGAAHALGGYWGGGSLGWISLPALAGVAAGWLLARRWSALRRLLIDDETLAQRVGRRAEAAFLEEGVYATRDRTGVLLLLALFERRAVVLPDRGIAQRVDPAEWRRIADALAEGARRDRHAAALVEAISACGQLLEASGMERRSDDRDELADEPRLHDE